MENQKRVGCEIELPREIIQHIQSFLNEKIGGRSSILSKSWYGAWSTRPDIVFTQSHFQGFSRIDDDQFSKFTKKTMQRYEDLNLNIHSLQLQMMETSLATELIVRAIRLGPVFLKINLSDSSFVLPKEVLESKTLTRLSLHRCTLDLHTRNNITCSQLKSLSFTKMNVINCDLIRDLVSRCPLIERLTIETVHYRIKLHEFHDLEFDKLEYLRLRCSDARECLHKHALWPKLPHLKQLVILASNRFDASDKWNGVRICSPSLERIVIRLMPYLIMNAEFDAPNLRRFDFQGSPSSHLHFEETSVREWELDIHMSFYAYLLSASSLDQLAKTLSPSKVSHLKIYVTDIPSKWCDWVEDAGCLGTPLVVESLRLVGSEASHAFMDFFFSICRPKFIIQSCNVRDAIDKYLVELVCKRVLEEVNEEPWKDKYGEKFVRFQLRWG